MPLIDVTVRSTDPYLTTTGAVKAMLQTTSTADDARLDTCILAASRWAEKYVGYPLVAQGYRECLRGYGTRSLMLARTPVVSVAALWDSTSTDDAAQVLSSAYQLNRGAGLISRPTGFEWTVPTEPWLETRPLPGQEFPGWMADYVAGYTYAGISTADALWSTEKGTTSTGRTLPEDIEQAVVMKAVGIFDGSDDVLEESVGDLSVRYASGSGMSGRLGAAEMLLDGYRRTA